MKRKFNIIDIFVVLIFIAVMAAAVWFFANIGDGYERYVYFTVELRGVMPGYEDYIIREMERQGEVRDAIRNYFLGTVYNVEVRQGTQLTFDQTNQEVRLELVPELNDIFLTIRGHGTQSYREILVEGQLVTIGRSMYIRGNGFANRGFVVELWTEERN